MHRLKLAKLVSSNCNHFIRQRCCERMEKLFAAKPFLAKKLSMTSLRRRMIEDMQVRNLSSQTQATYVEQVSLFARHFNKSPEVLGPDEIRSYQVYLNERKEAWCC